MKEMNLIDVSQLMTIADAARHTGYMTEAALRSLIAVGKLEVVRIGSSVFVTRQEIDALMKRRGVR